MLTLQDIENLGPALRVLRRCAGKLQKQIGGLRQNQVYAYERGQFAPSFENLVRYLSSLDMDFHALQDALECVRQNEPIPLAPTRSEEDK